MMPLYAQAATVQELQAQIADLLTRITTLQQQLGSTPGATAPGDPVVAGVAQCPHVSRVLKRGTTGEDVTRLQQFLALDPAVYPEAQVSGYYGALTEAAVKRFQCKNKLVCDGSPESTGFGVAGPRTAALLALQCADPVGRGVGTPSAGGFLRVTPISGNAPLNVSIEATVNTVKSCAAATYEVDYGDNAPKTLIAVPANTCGELRQVLNHLYTAPGTYIVTLRSGVQQTHATVTVGGLVPVPASSADSMSGTPQSGTVPFTVTFRGNINATGRCDANTYTLDFGNGQTAPLAPSGCSPSSFTVTHVYTTAGAFVAKLTKDAGNVHIGEVSISATGGTAGGSNTSSYKSYFAAIPGHEGNLATVLAEFEIPSSCTAFQLNWGDASAQITQAQGTCSGSTVLKQFSHTYQNAGSYTIVLRRGSNLDEKSEAGVVLGGN